MLIVKKHFAVLFFALLTALFTGLPSLFFLQRVDVDFKTFTGIWPEFNGDTLYYQSRVKEVLDGNAEINHPYFKEHKGLVYPQATGAEWFAAQIARISRLSVPKLQVVLDFVAPFIIFLLTYFVFYLISKERVTALVLPLLMYTIVWGGLGKPVHPQITFPLLILFLIFWLLLLLGTRRKWLFAILAGAALGLLFLTYFYHWSFLLVVLGLSAIGLVVKKDFLQLKYIAVILIIGLLIGIPYFILVAKGFSAPFHLETSVRVGFFKSHLPETLPRLAVAVAWFLFFLFFSRYYKIGRKTETLAVASLLIANILYPNHQIITGVIIQNANHWATMPIFIYALSAHYMFGVIRGSGLNVRFNQLAIVALIIFLLVPSWRLSTFLLPQAMHSFSKGGSEGLQYYAPVMDWLNQNVEKDAVIFSNLEFMRLAPVYTHANVYYTEYAFNLPGSDQEIIERALLSHFFELEFFNDKNFGMSEDTRILWTQPSQTERNTHRVYDFLKIRYAQKYSLEKETEKVRGVYEDLKAKGWDVGLLNSYQLDYIVWDKKLHPKWGLDGLEDLELVKSFGDVEVWKFKIYPDV